MTKTGNELQGKATQNEIATKNDHKCDVLILHIFPTLFQVLHDLGAFTLHRKTANPSTKINKKMKASSNMSPNAVVTLHVKPIDFNEFHRFWGWFHSPPKKVINLTQ